MKAVVKLFLILFLCAGLALPQNTSYTIETLSPSSSIEEIKDFKQLTQLLEKHGTISTTDQIEQASNGLSLSRTILGLVSNTSPQAAMTKLRLKLAELLAQANARSTAQVIGPLLPQPKEVLFMNLDKQNELEILKKAYKNEPNNIALRNRYEALSERLNKSRSMTIRNYLAYYTEIRNSKKPFELKDLDEGVSPEHIRLFIEENIKAKDLSYLQLEFLFAEMIRRLKLGKNYSPHSWPENEDSNLHKTKIFKHIFSDLLAGWEKDIPAFKSAKKEVKLNLKQAKARLGIFIAFHFLKEEINGFHEQGEINQQDNFWNIVSGLGRRENDEDNYYDRLHYFPGIPFPLNDGKGAFTHFEKADLRYINLKDRSWASYELNFKKADLRHSNLEKFRALENSQTGFDFSEASLVDSNLKDLFAIEIYFSSSDLRRANLKRLSYHSLIFFHGADLREAALDDRQWAIDSFGVDKKTKRKTTILRRQTEEGLANLFDGYITAEPFFNIEGDEEAYDSTDNFIPTDEELGNIEEDYSDYYAIAAPLLLLFSFQSELLSLMGTFAFLYLVIQLANTPPIVANAIKPKTLIYPKIEWPSHPFPTSIAPIEASL